MLLKLLFFSKNEELHINRNIVLSYLSNKFIIENDKLFLNNISFDYKLVERENSVSLFLRKQKYLIVLEIELFQVKKEKILL